MRMILAAAGWLATITVASAQTWPMDRPAPFTRTLSDTAPLAFGMDVEDVARVLRVPLNYVGGPPGNETFFAVRDDGGGGFFRRDDRIYLQFRRGRLAGFKGDWGRNWMWR